MTHYLGLDLSLTCSGMALLVHGSNGYELGLCWEEIKPPNGIKGAGRLYALAHRFEEALDKLAATAFLAYEGQPVRTVACIEGYSYASTGTLAQLGEWGGIVRLALYRRGIAFCVVPPSTLKKATTGRGDAKKPDMRRHVDAKHGPLPATVSDDIIDAIALAHFLAAACGEPQREKLLAWDQKRENGATTRRSKPLKTRGS